jgi:hypothetical protein
MTALLRRTLSTVLLLGTLALPAMPALAQTAVEPADFAQRKALHIHIEQQEIAIITESLGCIGLATDEAGIKACFAKKRQQDDALRAQHR